MLIGEANGRNLALPPERGSRIFFGDRREIL
jgi:hypothetical protein